LGLSVTTYDQIRGESGIADPHGESGVTSRPDCSGLHTGGAVGPHFPRPRGRDDEGEDGQRGGENPGTHVLLTLVDAVLRYSAASIDALPQPYGR
jgi:hypothetical protein